MKRVVLTKNLLMLLAIALITSLSVNVYAQRNSWPGKDSLRSESGIPNLTADQQAKIKGFKIANQKEAIDLQNQLAEKNAHLNTLEFSDKPDKVSIYKTIDEIGVLQGKILKLKIDLRMDIASILTDEQKVYFYSHREGNYDSQGMGMRQRHEQKQGQGLKHNTNNSTNQNVSSSSKTDKK